jgi:hypothetical protein
VRTTLKANANVPPTSMIHVNLHIKSPYKITILRRQDRLWHNCYCSGKEKTLGSQYSPYSVHKSLRRVHAWAKAKIVLQTRRPLGGRPMSFTLLCNVLNAHLGDRWILLPVLKEKGSWFIIMVFDGALHNEMLLLKRQHSPRGPEPARYVSQG